MTSHDSWMKALREISDVLETDEERFGSSKDAAEDFIDFCRAVGHRDPNAISAARGFAAAVDDELFEERK